MAENESKKVLLDLPLELYERFLASQIRRESNTDAEGLRTAIKQAIQHEQKSQEKSGQGGEIAEKEAGDASVEAKPG